MLYEIQCLDDPDLVQHMTSKQRFRIAIETQLQ